MTEPTHEKYEAFGRYERESWIDVAGRYPDTFGRWTRLAVEPLLDASAVRAGERLLDVACGPGFAAIAAAKRGAKVAGVDIAPPMVAAAARACPEGEFREADGAALPFDASTFDVVVANFGIQHFPDADRALREIARVLKPGGRITFSVWDAPEHSVLQRLVHEAAAAGGAVVSALPPSPPAHRFADPVATKATLEACGFRDVASRAIEVHETVDTAEGMLDMLRRGTVRLGASLRGQTPEVYARIEAAFVKSVQPYRVPGGFAPPMQAVITSARKG